MRSPETMARRDSNDTVGNDRGTRRAPRQLSAKLLLLFAGGFVGLLLGEGVLRLFGYSTPDLYVWDPVVGMALRPNAEGWYTREGRDYVRINSRGLRDREHTAAKPANTVRVAVLGDSMAEALQLPMEQTFWAIAERQLEECRALGGQRVEAINFGVSGYGTGQELLTLRDRVWQYDPDIVLLAVTTRNDVGDGSRAIKRSAEVPYFVLSNGQLVLDDSFLRTGRQNSTLYRTFRWVRSRSRFLEAVNEAAARAYTWYQRRNRRSGWSYLADYQQPEDAVWREAWAVTEVLIVRMRDEVEQRRAKFFVATLSGSVQVDPDPQVRLDAMKEYGIDDFFYPDRRVGDLCEREHIPVLVLAPGMQRFAEENHVHLHGFGRSVGTGHWNQQGHRLAGERIATWLCERLTR